MKGISFITLIIIAATVSRAQTSNFYRTYNFSGMQGGLGIVSMPDGGFVGTGQHQDNGSQGECDVYVYRVDACGNLLWMNLIGVGGQQGGKGITYLSDNTLAIVGLYLGRGYLAKLDLNGNLLWEHCFSGPDWTTAVAELPSHDLVVSGFGSNQVWLMKTDSLGNVLWARTLNGGGQYNSSVTVAPNGNIYVDGTYGVSNGDLSISCFDVNGNLQWSNSYGYTGFANPDHEHFGSKLFYDDSDHSLIAISQTYVNGNNDILLMKVDAVNGTPIWSRVVGDAGSDQARDIVKIPGGYAILGNTSSYNVSAASNPSVLTEDMLEKDVLLFAVSTAGSLKWARTYGANSRDKGIGLRYNGDGSFLISAYTSSAFFNPMDFDPLFIRTDSTARLACQYSVPLPTVQAVNIAAVAGNSANTVSPGLVPANSVVNAILPSDRYVCLSCATDPIFIPSDTVVCVNEPVYFYNTTTYGLTCFQQWSINNILWDGSVDTIQYVFDTPGVYPILLYSNCGSSTDTFRINIRVKPYPDPEFTVNGNCLNDSTRFTNSSTIPSGNVAAWQWSFGDGVFSSDPSPVRVYGATGTYPVILTATSEFGCTKTDTDIVVIHPLPVPGFTTQEVCQGQETPFFNNSYGPFPLTSYRWDFGDSSTSADPSPTHIFLFPGRHFSALEATDVHGCRQTFYNDVIVQPKPLASFSIDPTDCDPSTPFRFNNTSLNFITCKWYFGDGNSSDEKAPMHFYRDDGSYSIRLFLTSDKGCTDSVEQSLVLLEDFALWVPNTFTPNGDGLNDRFSPLSKGVKKMELQILDRWGRTLYESEGAEVHWDGKISDRTVQNDVFLYRLRLIDRCDQSHERIGRVSVVK